MAGAQRRQSRINRRRVLHLDWRLGLIFAFANLILVARALRFVWNRVGRAEAAHIPRRSVSDMENQPGPQDTSKSMWPVSGGAPREQRVPLTPEDALRQGAQPAHDVHDRGVPLSIFQSVQSASDPAQLLQSAPAPVPEEKERDAAGDDVGIALPRENSAIRFAPPKLPEWFWSGSSASPSETAQPEAREEKAAEAIETYPDVVSRLSALRGAVSALGMKSLSRRKELPMPDRGEPAEVFAVAADTAAVVPTEVPEDPVKEVREQAADARTMISAPPEKVVERETQKTAPKEFIPVKKRDAADEWDEGEVRILPARRGQYER